MTKECAQNKKKSKAIKSTITVIIGHQDTCAHMSKTNYSSIISPYYLAIQIRLNSSYSTMRRQAFCPLFSGEENIITTWLHIYICVLDSRKVDTPIPLFSYNILRNGKIYCLKLSFKRRDIFCDEQYDGTILWYYFK